MMGERRVVSEAQISHVHTPQAVSPDQSRFPELAAQSYALGWFVQPYRGHAMLRHSGNIDGYSTLASFMPDAGLGVVVLTNLNSNPVPYILSWNVYDRLLGLEPVPWGDRYRADYDETPPLTQPQAAAAVQIATGIVQSLDAAGQEPTRTRIRDSMIVYERDVLRDVTWRP